MRSPRGRGRSRSRRCARGGPSARSRSGSRSERAGVSAGTGRQATASSGRRSIGRERSGRRSHDRLRITVSGRGGLSNRTTARYHSMEATAPGHLQRGAGHRDRPRTSALSDRVGRIASRSPGARRAEGGRRRGSCRGPAHSSHQAAASCPRAGRRRRPERPAAVRHESEAGRLRRDRGGERTGRPSARRRNARTSCCSTSACRCWTASSARPPCAGTIARATSPSSSSPGRQPGTPRSARPRSARPATSRKPFDPAAVSRFISDVLAARDPRRTRSPSRRGAAARRWARSRP